MRSDASALELQKARRISTLTSCFRNVFSSMPPELQIRPSPTQRPVLAHGKGKFIAEIKPAAYRRHPGGIFSMRSDKCKVHMNLQTCSSLANYYNRLGDQVLYEHFLTQTACLSLAALARDAKCKRCLF